jgi:hypothetical protein
MAARIIGTRLGLDARGRTGRSRACLRLLDQ